jgi:glyoxylase-like metal-dependent hydrolase (beta-lactamase superfamily II)
MRPEVKAFFDPETSTLSYVVWDEATLDGIILDPVWNYDQASSALSSKSVDELCAFVSEKKLTIHYIMETHAHADHVSGAQLLKKRFPKAPLAIGKISELCKVPSKKSTTYQTLSSPMGISLTCF